MLIISFKGPVCSHRENRVLAKNVTGARDIITQQVLSICRLSPSVHSTGCKRYIDPAATESRVAGWN